MKSRIIKGPQAELSNPFSLEESWHYTDYIKNTDRGVYFNSDVDTYSIYHLVNILHELEDTYIKKKKGPKKELSRHFDLYITTDGGDTFESLKCYDVLRSSCLESTAIAYGCVASAGTIMMCGADHAKIHQNGILMLHESTISLYEHRKHQLEIENILNDKIMKKYVDIYREKCKGKKGEKIITMEWLEKDRWLTSEEALELGIVDEIIVNLPHDK